MGLLDPNLFSNPVLLNQLKGLLGNMPISKLIRGEESITGEGLLGAMRAMPVFDPSASEEFMGNAMNAMTPMGATGMLFGMTRKQAKAGGEIGLNSQFYKGGEFLPGSSATEKGKMQFPKAMRKGNMAEVEPFVKAARPLDGAVPLAKAGEWDWPAWRETGALKPYEKFAEYQKNPALLAADSAKAEAFNRGARWELDGKYFDVNGNPIE